MSDPAPSNGTAFRLRHLETTVEAAVRDVNSLKIGQAITDRQLDAIAKDVAHVADDVGAMRKAAEVREQRDVVTVRWRIGTALAVIAAIISAAAIVASAIPS
jgi:hypothetical protein